MERSSLVGSLTNAIKDHSRAFGVTAAVIGAILVIYYCGSINFYPSGLTIADTLFFLWVVVVFGFYYSVVAFSFFIASVFWVTIFAKPINFVLKLKKNKADIVVPLPKSDWFMVLGGGFAANLLILGISYFKGHPLLAIFVALFLIGFIYTLIENVSKRSATNDSLLDLNGKPINTSPIRPLIVKSIFYAFVYISPLLFGQVGGGVTRTTFETIGVRQEGVTLHVEAREYEAVLESYESAGLLSGLACRELCTIPEADILFTNIGENTKLKLSGSAGDLLLVLPTNAIKLVAQLKFNKSIQPTADAAAD